MPLPYELDKEIRSRFDELIEEVEKLLAECDIHDHSHASRYWEWIVKTSNLISMLFGNTDQRAKYQDIIEYDTTIGYVSENRRRWFLLPDVRRKVATLKGIRNNYVNGFYVSLEERIIADVSGDYMEQAKALLDEGIRDQYDHVPAAVLCGAVLEDALRRLCLRQTPTIKITKSNGQKKTMEPLIQDLQRSQVINNLEADQLRGWAKIRNYAAHGEFCNFERADVDGMLHGVKHFLAKHL